MGKEKAREKEQKESEKEEMAEREKLIELIVQCDKYNDILVCYNDRPKKTQAAEILADYLLSNGVIVSPCKVGDTVYVITSDSPTRIEETRVSQIKIEVKENSKISYRISAPCVYDTWGEAHWTFCKFDFGKTVFLTKEEAEKALAERRKGK